MNNPLPVDPFSVAEAARRTWPALIEALLEAVCLVEPDGLRVVAANGAAGRLFGVDPAELVGHDMRATSSTPEDEAFWERVSTNKGCGHLVSESFVVRADGDVVPVVRRVSRIEPAPGNALWVVALVDRGEHVRARAALEASVAELAATLESVLDGVLVIDLAGHIRNFNRRFAALWELPDEVVALRADDEVFEWMRRRVESPAAYERRLAEIEADATLRATDTLRLRSGALIERATTPQLSRGRPIGRVFTYRMAPPATA
jgi:PAS domain S-box-containing protein